MPNGGPTPSCILCKSMEKTTRHCAHHDFRVGMTIPRLLCSKYQGPLFDDLLSFETPDLNTLASNSLYIWLEISSISPDGVYAHEFNLRPFVSIEKYKTWNEDEEKDMFWQLLKEQRELYQRRGYDVK